MNLDFPREFGRVVRRCLEKDPSRRFQGADDLRLELEEVRREFISGELTSEPRVTSSLSSATSNVVGESTGTSGSAPGSSRVGSGISGEGSSDSFVSHSQRAGLTRLLVVYTLVSALVLFLVRWAMLEFGLPGWVLPGAFVLLIVGLPILVATAWIQAGSTPSASSPVSQPNETATSPGGLRKWLTWRRAIGGGALAFLAWGIVISGYVLTRSQGIGPAASLVSAGVLEEKSRILIADFLNQTDDPMLGQAMKEAFTVDLSQSSIVRLATPPEIASALRRMEMDPKTALDKERAIEVALRDGIPAVVTGQINPAGSGAVLSVRLLEPKSGEALAAFRENAAGPDGMIPAIDRLSSRLREKLGESLKTIRANPPLDQVDQGTGPPRSRHFGNTPKPSCSRRKETTPIGRFPCSRKPRASTPPLPWPIGSSR